MTIRFDCEGCGYDAQVSGGLDMGMVSVTRTCFCPACNELVDVRVGREGQIGPTGDPEYDRDLDRCHLCGGTELRPWESGDPCPRCGGAMNPRDDGGESMILWD